MNTTLRGLQQIPARIFLWPEGTKVVVSDVDGTVTRSDVLGVCFMPYLLLPSYTFLWNVCLRAVVYALFHCINVVLNPFANRMILACELLHKLSSDHVFCVHYVYLW